MKSEKRRKIRKICSFSDGPGQFAENLAEFSGIVLLMRNGFLNGGKGGTMLADLTPRQIKRKKVKMVFRLKEMTLNLPALDKWCDKCGTGRK